MALALGVRPATLRRYDRLGLLTPKRNRRGEREYVPRDLPRARRILESRLAARNRCIRRGRV